MQELNFEDDRSKPSILDETIPESRAASTKGKQFTYEEEEAKLTRLNQFIEDCIKGD